MQGYRDSGPPSPSNTELATFQVFSNSDYVDMSKLAGTKPTPSDFFSALEAEREAEREARAATPESGRRAPERRRESLGSSASQRAPSALLPRSFGSLQEEAHVEEAEELEAADDHYQPQRGGHEFLFSPVDHTTPPRASSVRSAAVEEPEESAFAAAVSREQSERLQEGPRGDGWGGALPRPPSAGRASAGRASVGRASARDEEEARTHRARKSFYAPRYDEAADDEHSPEVVAEKEALLGELKSMEKLGTARLAREFSMADNLQALQFEYDRIQSDQSAVQTVEMAKGGIRMGVGVLEMMAKKFGLSAVDGWYNAACGDMGKYNRPLHKLYKKYWRRAPASPITEIAYLILGSAAWTVVQNKVLGGASSASAPSAAPPSGPPPPAQGIQPSYEAPRSAVPARPMRPPQHASIAGGGWGVAASPATSGEAPAPASTSSSQAAAAAEEERKLQEARRLQTVRESEALAQERSALARDREALVREYESLAALRAQVTQIAQATQAAQSAQLSSAQEDSSEEAEPSTIGAPRLLTLQTSGSSKRRKRTSTAARRALQAGVIKI